MAPCIMRINQQSVIDFKTRYCDENSLISTILREEYHDWARDPILDVGCGLGDISATAFGDRRVYLLDRLDYSTFPTRPLHQRITEDFFRFRPDGNLRSALFSHVLQFLDDDREELEETVRGLGVSQLITVTNDNTGKFGELVNWASEEFPESNPEVNIEGFARDFDVVKQNSFIATLRCSDFHQLAEQVCYVLDMALNEERASSIESFLEGLLSEPAIKIDQTIRGYIAGGVHGRSA